MDEFVAGFVGRDRGFRSLSFNNAAGLTLLPAATATADRAAEAPAEGWLLLTNDGGGPAGWLPPRSAGPGEGTDRGSLFTLGSSLRQALDAALSSPSGAGVAIDADGRVAGLIEPSAVLQRLRADGN